MDFHTNFKYELRFELQKPLAFCSVGFVLSRAHPSRRRRVARWVMWRSCFVLSPLSLGSGYRSELTRRAFKNRFRAASITRLASLSSPLYPGQDQRWIKKPPPGVGVRGLPSSHVRTGLKEGHLASYHQLSRGPSAHPAFASHHSCPSSVLLIAMAAVTVPRASANYGYVFFTAEVLCNNKPVSRRGGSGRRGRGVEGSRPIVDRPPL